MACIQWYGGEITAVLYSFTHAFQMYTKCRNTAVRFCFGDDAFNDGIIEMELTMPYKLLCLVSLHRFNSYLTISPHFDLSQKAICSTPLPITLIYSYHFIWQWLVATSCCLMYRIHVVYSATHLYSKMVVGSDQWWLSGKVKIMYDVYIYEYQCDHPNCHFWHVGCPDCGPILVSNTCN